MLDLSVLNGEFSRFHVDPRMKHTQMAAMFQTWLRNSVNRSVADHVLVAILDAKPEAVVGYVTVRIKHDPDHSPPVFADMALGATNPEYRHLDVTWKLLHAATEWAQSKNVNWITSVTHEKNKPMRGCAEAMGMIVEEVSGDFHFWISQSGPPPPVNEHTDDERCQTRPQSSAEETLWRLDAPKKQIFYTDGFRGSLEPSDRQVRCIPQSELLSTGPSFESIETINNILDITSCRMSSEPVELKKLDILLKNAEACGFALVFWKIDATHALSPALVRFFRQQKHFTRTEVTFRIEINEHVQRVLNRQTSKVQSLECCEFTEQQPSQRMSELAVSFATTSRFGLDPNMTRRDVSNMFVLFMEQAVTGDKGHITFVARRTIDSLAVGLAIALRKFDFIEVELLVVDREYQRCGVGLLLMTRLMDWALAHGTTYCLVTAGEDDIAAKSLFEKCGGLQVHRWYHAHIWLGKDAPNDPVYSLIPLNKPFLTDRALDYIRHALEHDIATHSHFGPLCEKKLKDTLQAEHVLLTCSGTAALEMCALSLSLKTGDEVIMPSYTFVSTANAFACQGATPVLVDIRTDTQNIDETKIEAAITPRTRAICCVHYAGVPCEMDTIMAIARSHNLYVVEDNAHGVFSSYKGRKLGTIGDCGALSFHYTKNMVCGEGGAVIINNELLIRKAWIAWEKGTNRMEFLNGKVSKYHWVDKGSSYVMSEILAAVLYSQLEAWDVINDSRMKIWNRYHSAFEYLEALSKVKRPALPEGCAHNAHIYYLRIPNEGDFESVVAEAKTRKISLFTHYLPLHQSHGAAKYARSLDCPESEACSRSLLRLPMWVDMTMLQVEAVIRVFHDALGIPCTVCP